MYIRLAALSLVLLISAACTGGDSGNAPAATPTPTPTATASPTPTATPTPAAITTANAAQLKPGASFPATTPQRIVWSSTGVLWVVGTRTVDEVDPTTGTGKHVLELREPERILGLSPAGLVATTGAGPTGSATAVRLRQIGFTEPRQTLESGGVTTAASFFGNRVALVSGDQIGVSLWDTSTGARVGALTGFQTAAPVYNLVVSEDGARAAWVSRATLQFMDVAANRLGTRVQTEDFIGTYAFAPDGRMFATALGVPNANGGIEGRIQLWDPAAGVEARRITIPAPPTSLAFSAAAPILATGTATGVTFWSTADGTKIGTLDEATAGHVRLVALSSDGSTLATVAEDGTVRFWRPTR